MRDHRDGWGEPPRAVVMAETRTHVRQSIWLSFTGSPVRRSGVICRGARRFPSGSRRTRVPSRVEEEKCATVLGEARHALARRGLLDQLTLSSVGVLWRKPGLKGTPLSCWAAPKKGLRGSGKSTFDDLGPARSAEA